MSTVSHSAPSGAPAPQVPVRHGRARLEVIISGQRYRLNRAEPNVYEPRSKVWSLTHVGGDRPGTTHRVSKYRGRITCSCEDAYHTGAICKHARALVACGLLSAHGSPFHGPAARVLTSAPAAPSSEGGA